MCYIYASCKIFKSDRVSHSDANKHIIGVCPNAETALFHYNKTKFTCSYVHMHTHTLKHTNNVCVFVQNDELIAVETFRHHKIMDR